MHLDILQSQLIILQCSQSVSLIKVTERFRQSARTNTYDNKGRVKERKGSLGTSSTYDYDGKDRVTAMHYKNASGAEELPDNLYL